FSRQFFDTTLRFASLVQISAGDGNRTVVRNIDLRARLFGQSADGGTTLTNHVTNLLGVDLHGQHARSKFRHLGTGTVDGLFHLAQDVHTAFMGLSQCNLHDFLGNALDLDVHLQSSNTFLGTGYLEVHITQVILVAQNVGQYG